MVDEHAWFHIRNLLSYLNVKPDIEYSSSCHYTINIGIKAATGGSVFASGVDLGRS